MILLDTHTLLWLALEPKRLSRRAAAAVRKEVSLGGLGIASISLWEIAMLIAEAKLAIRGTQEAWIAGLIQGTGVVVHEITPAVAALATQFPEGFPKDPADRLIAATARAGGYGLVTRDRRLRASPLLNTVW